MPLPRAKLIQGKQLLFGVRGKIAQVELRHEMLLLILRHRCCIPLVCGDRTCSEQGYCAAEQQLRQGAYKGASFLGQEWTFKISVRTSRSSRRGRHDGSPRVEVSRSAPLLKGVVRCAQSASVAPPLRPRRFGQNASVTSTEVSRRELPRRVGRPHRSGEMQFAKLPRSHRPVRVPIIYESTACWTTRGEEKMRGTSARVAQFFGLKTRRALS